MGLLKDFSIRAVMLTVLGVLCVMGGRGRLQRLFALGDGRW